MAEKRESNTGLIITLVFFILATLGLGVSTYYGFAEQDKLRGDAKKALEDKNKMTSVAQFNKAQAALYWSFISSTDPVGNPAELKTNFDDLSGAGNSGWVKDTQGDPEFPKTKKRMDDLVRTASTKLAINAATGGPNTNLVNLLNEMKAENKRMSDALVKANSDKKAADDAKTAAEANAADQIANAKKSYDERFSMVRKEFGDYKTRLDEKSRLVDPDALLKELADNKSKELEEGFNVKDKEFKERDSKNRKIIVKLEKEKADLEKKFGEQILEGKPNGKVVEIAGTGSTVFINLGSVVDVRPGDLFSIFGMRPDGQPNSNPKGRLEVVSVIGDQMAKARVVDIKDRISDPVLKGDYLFNPVWAPNFRAKVENRKRIVVIGMPKIFSRSKDPLKDFMRVMEEHNVEVEAFIDPVSISIKPNGKEGVSVRTDYLIIAEDPILRDKTREYEILKKELEAECDRYRVEKVRLDRFLDLIGIVGN